MNNWVIKVVHLMFQLFYNTILMLTGEFFWIYSYSMVLANKYIVFLTAALPVNGKYKYKINFLSFTPRPGNDRAGRLHSKEIH